MNKYTLLIVSFLIFTTISFSQIHSGEVIYKIKERDSILQQVLDSPEISSDVHALEYTKSLFSDVRRSFPYLNYRLSFTTQEALFQVATTYMAGDAGMDINKSLNMTNSNGIFYTNIVENMRLHERNYLDKDWLIKDKADVVEWEITNETKQIQGYTCYKAVADGPSDEIAWSEVIAWFAPDIPFQFGPLDYVGLPGLILELDYGFYTFYADKIDFSNQRIEIKRPTKGKLLNRKEYDKQIKEMTDRLKGGSR